MQSHPRNIELAQREKVNALVQCQMINLIYEELTWNATRKLKEIRERNEDSGIWSICMQVTPNLIIVGLYHLSCRT